MNVFKPLPQILQNVKIDKGAQPLNDAQVQAAIAQATARLGNTGRVLVRPSGTEPLIRVMAEGSDEKLVQDVVHSICAAIDRTRQVKPDINKSTTLGP